MPDKLPICVGIDAGGASTRCVIGVIEDESLRFLGFGEQPSTGWSKGRLADVEAASAAIGEAVREAERTSGVSVDAAVVGMGGGGIDSVNSRGLYEFGRPREIQTDDLGYAVQLATQVQPETSRMLLQACPQDFTVDGRSGYRNPHGTRGARLEANVRLITAPAPEHQSLLNAVHNAHLAVEETVFEAMAACYASVLPEERTRGVAVLDIGAQSTGMVIYDGDALVGARTLPVCGDHFTRDVAWGLTVSFEDAQRIKEEYGCAILGLTSDSSLIEVPSPAGRPPREAPRRQLNSILEARAEELFLYAQAELTEAGMQQELLEGVVLTGGCARLNGMCDMAERVLNCQARNGLPAGIEQWPEEINDPAWSTVAGLAMYSARLKFRKELKRRAPGLLGYLVR
jgi:cell division protein FtsA